MTDWKPYRHGSSLSVIGDALRTDVGDGSGNGDQNGAVFKCHHLVGDAGGQRDQFVRAEFEPFALGSEGDAAIQGEDADGPGTVWSGRPDPAFRAISRRVKPGSRTSVSESRPWSRRGASLRRRAS